MKSHESYTSVIFLRIEYNQHVLNAHRKLGRIQILHEEFCGRVAQYKY